MELNENKTFFTCLKRNIDGFEMKFEIDYITGYESQQKFWCLLN